MLRAKERAAEGIFCPRTGLLHGALEKKRGRFFL